MTIEFKPSVFMEAGDTAGGGGNPAPAPAAPKAPIGTESSTADSPAVSSVPEAVELDDNQIIRFKGSDKALKASDVRAFQAQFTKASQRAAALEKALQKEKADRERYQQEVQRYSQQSQPQNQSEDIFAAIRQLPYLTGQDAVGVVEGITQEIQRRDQVILAALKKMQQMEQVLGTLNQTYKNQGFDAKISKWLKEGGYPDEAADLAKEIYLAYDGDDLDSEFPQIFANRWNQIEKILEAKRNAKIQANRKQPFIPGKGGTANPSKPLQMKADLSPAEVAEELWESMQGSDT